MQHTCPLTLFLVMLSSAVVCQDSLTYKDAPFNRYKCSAITLNAAIEKKEMPFPIDSIEVSDIRQDTTKFGYYHTALGPTIKYCFKNRAAAEIAGFLNNSLLHHPTATAYKLLYCLKKLWIANADTTEGDPRQPTVKRSKLYLKAELYLQQDSCFYPLYRFDSTFIFLKPPSSYSIFWVQETLIQSLEPLKKLSPEKVMRRSCVKQSDMNEYYASEKHTVIANAKKLQKGVYLNIEQFKNNQPAYADFEISFDKLADVLMVKDENGTYAPTNNAWGFCDSERLFIHLGPNYFQLFKTGDTYELSGTNWLDFQIRYYTPIVYGSSVGPGGTLLSAALAEATKKGKVRLDKLKPLQLDMETGKVY